MVPNSKATSETHFLTLDALRGVAAVAVLLFHVPQIFGGKEHLQSGWMAVDFFFILSGFVVAHAYEDRLRTGAMSWGDYARRRIIRLYPLIVLGTLIGAVYSVVSNTRTVVGTLLVFVPSALTIPTPTHYWDSFTKLDAPAWSLFFELVASGVFAFAAPKMKSRTLFIGCALMAVIYSLHSVVIHMPNDGDHYHNWPWGFPRVLSTFGIGVLLKRLHAFGYRAPKLPAWLLAIALLVTFLIPFGPITFIMIFFLYPVLVLLGASSLLGKGEKWLGKFAGELSYPLYIVHSPILFLGFLATKQIPTLNSHLRIVGYLFAGLSVAIAYAALKIFDEPVRRMLTNWTRRSSRQAVVALD